MSDALAYLLKVRPEAMKSYFDFIKQSGRHLDRRTRAIISVITKVDKQTERGFRQYLVRALQAGVSPDEIIDALFVAFPTLGLSKIVWAVDVLLEMDIPEFRPENIGISAEWHELGPVDSFGEGFTHHECDGREVFVLREGEHFKIYDTHCPHQVTNIPALALEGNVLTCPRHQWKFDIRTGECIEKGDRPLHEFQCRVEDGVLLGKW